jgi:predicted acyltransferase
MQALFRAISSRWYLRLLAYVLAWTVPGLISAMQLMMSYSLRGDSAPLSLLAYIISFLIAPLIDYNWFGDATVSLSLRSGGQAWFEYFMEPRAASLAFGLCGLLFIFAILVICHRKRWILKL